ncbi:MAG: hypothetical protein QM811_09215 [Pirellulales bacterium]
MREFWIHDQFLTGDWQDASKQRGPNPKGIVGDVTIVPGPYEGMAALPQMWDKRYFTQAVSAPYSKRLDTHLHVDLKTPKNLPTGFLDELTNVLESFGDAASK